MVVTPFANLQTVLVDGFLAAGTTWVRRKETWVQREDKWVWHGAISESRESIEVALTGASVRDDLNEQAVRVGNMQAGPVAAVNRRRTARPQIRDDAVLVESLDPDGEMVEAGLRALPDRKMPGLANRELHEVRLPLTLARQVEHTGIEIDRPLQIAACDRDVIDGRRLQACLRGGRTPARHAERGERASY